MLEALFSIALGFQPKVSIPKIVRRGATFCGTFKGIGDTAKTQFVAPRHSIATLNRERLQQGEHTQINDQVSESLPSQTKSSNPMSTCLLCQRTPKKGTTEHHLIPRACHSNKWFKKKLHARANARKRSRSAATATRPSTSLCQKKKNSAAIITRSSCFNRIRKLPSLWLGPPSKSKARSATTTPTSKCDGCSPKIILLPSSKNSHRKTNQPNQVYSEFLGSRGSGPQPWSDESVFVNHENVAPLEKLSMEPKGPRVWQFV